MEPHIGTVFHEDNGKSDSENRYSSYVEYGKRFMKLLEQVSEGVSA
jgi:hypothetical protein